MLNHPLEQLWQLSWQAAAVAVFVLVLRGVFARVLAPRWRHLLWFLVLGRLLIPTLPQSRASLFNIEALFGNQPSSPELVPTTDSTRTTSIKFEYGTISNPPATTFQPGTAKQSTPFWSNPATLKYIWLTIAAMILLRLIIANLRFAYRLRRGSQETPAHLVGLLRSCRQEIHLSRCPGLLVTHAVDSPAVTGVFRPRVLLPADSAATLSTEQIRLIFLHELAHIKSYDAAVDWLWSILQALHWFNPILWLIAPLRRADREQARDEMVLSITGPQQASLYGQTLLNLSQATNLPPWCPGLVGMVSGKQRLQRRIKMIASFEGTRDKTRWAQFVLICAAGCSALTNPSIAELPATTQPSPLSTSSADANIETCVYDISDLLFAPTDKDGDQSLPRQIEDLKTYIEENVSTISGTPRADLKVQADSARKTLTITDTQAHQSEILYALESLKHSRGGTTSIETRLFTFDDSQPAKLPEWLPQRFALLSGAGKDRMDQLLTREQTKELIEAVEKSKSTAGLTAPRLTLFDGQRATITVQTHQAYVESLTQVWAKDGNGKIAALFDPHVSTVNAMGLDLNYTVRSSRDGRTTFLVAQIKMSKLLALVPVTVPWPDPSVKITGTYQRPITATYERSFTCAIPDHTTLLLSGMVRTIKDGKEPTTKPIADTPAEDPSIAAERQKHVYLLITPANQAIQKPPTTYPLLP